MLPASLRGAGREEVNEGVHARGCGVLFPVEGDVEQGMGVAAGGAAPAQVVQEGIQGA